MKLSLSSSRRGVGVHGYTGRSTHRAPAAAAAAKRWPWPPVTISCSHAGPPRGRGRHPHIINIYLILLSWKRQCLSKSVKLSERHGFALTLHCYAFHLLPQPRAVKPSDAPWLGFQPDSESRQLRFQNRLQPSKPRAGAHREVRPALDTKNTNKKGGGHLSMTKSPKLQAKCLYMFPILISHLKLSSKLMSNTGQLSTINPEVSL